MENSNYDTYYVSFYSFQILLYSVIFSILFILHGLSGARYFQKISNITTLKVCITDNLYSAPHETGELSKLCPQNYSVIS